MIHFHISTQNHPNSMVTVIVFIFIYFKSIIAFNSRVNYKLARTGQHDGTTMLSERVLDLCVCVEMNYVLKTRIIR